MKGFIITNVGIDMSSLKDEGTIILGQGTVFSEDEVPLIDKDDRELEYQDDFEFTYYKNTEKVDISMYNDPGDVFKDYKAEIIELLIDNLKTNYLHN